MIALTDFLDCSLNADNFNIQLHNHYPMNTFTCCNSAYLCLVILFITIPMPTCPLAGSRRERISIVLRMRAYSGLASSDDERDEMVANGVIIGHDDVVEAVEAARSRGVPTDDLDVVATVKDVESTVDAEKTVDAERNSAEIKRPSKLRKSTKRSRRRRRRNSRIGGRGRVGAASRRNQRIYPQAIYMLNGRKYIDSSAYSCKCGQRYNSLNIFTTLSLLSLPV